jgi:hypothetical protein
LHIYVTVKTGAVAGFSYRAGARLPACGGVPTTASPAGTPFKPGSIFVRDATSNSPAALPENNLGQLGSRHLSCPNFLAKEPAKKSGARDKFLPRLSGVPAA